MVIDLTQRRYMVKTFYSNSEECMITRKTWNSLIFEQEVLNALGDGHMVFEINRSRSDMVFVLRVFFSQEHYKNGHTIDIDGDIYLYPVDKRIADPYLKTIEPMLDPVSSGGFFHHDDIMKAGWLVTAFAVQTKEEAIEAAKNYLYSKNIPAIFYEPVNDSLVIRKFDNPNAMKRYITFNQWYNDIQQQNN